MIRSSSSKERKREEKVEEYTTSNCFYHFIDFALVGDIFLTSFHECKYFQWDKGMSIVFSIWQAIRIDESCALQWEFLQHVSMILREEWP